MITLTLHKNGKYWQAKWRNARGKQHGRSLGAIDKVSRRAAKLKIKRLETDLNHGRIREGRAPKLLKFCERYLDSKTDLSEGTKELYEITIRYLAGHFGDDCPIDRITRVDAADWRTAMAKGELASLNKRNHGVPSEATVCRSVRDAKAMFKQATRQRLLLFNPFDELGSTPPAPDKDWEYIDHPTLKKLLAACPNQDWRLLLALCRLAGLRRGEVLRLQWADVDMSAKRITVRNPGHYRTTKKRTRQVPIEPELHDLLF